MNKLWRIRLFGASVLWFWCSLALSEPQKLVMGYTDWLPFYSVDNQGQVYGVDIEIITKALAPFGYEVEFKPMPWTRRLHGLSSGGVDIVSSASLDPERTQYAYYSAPYYREQYVLYALRENQDKFKGKSLKELLNSGFRLGYYRGSAFTTELDQLLQSDAYRKQIHPATGFELLYRQLKSNRLDGFILEQSAHQRQNLSEKLLLQTVPLITLAEVKQHYIFSKLSTTQNLVEDFNRGLAQLMASGEYQRIFERYQANSWMLPL